MVKIYPLIHPTLIPIIESYPEYKDIVYELFREDESFHEICLDYEQCRKTLLYWQIQDTKDAIIRLGEYEEILRGLEQELMQYLTDCDSESQRRNAGLGGTDTLVEQKDSRKYCQAPIITHKDSSRSSATVDFSINRKDV